VTLEAISNRKCEGEELKLNLYLQIEKASPSGCCPIEDNDLLAPDASRNSDIMLTCDLEPEVQMLLQPDPKGCAEALPDAFASNVC